MMQGTRDKNQAQLTTMVSRETQTMLAMTESTIQMDKEMKIQIMQYLMNEDPYSDILQQFQNDRQCREIECQHKKYHLKKGSLGIHDADQDKEQVYWRVVIPDKQEIKIQLLKEIHCVPYLL